MNEVRMYPYPCIVTADEIEYVGVAWQSYFSRDWRVTMEFSVQNSAAQAALRAALPGQNTFEALVKSEQIRFLEQ